MRTPRTGTARRAVTTVAVLGLLALSACGGGDPEPAGTAGAGDGATAGAQATTGPDGAGGATDGTGGASAAPEATGGTVDVQARESDVDVAAPDGWRTWEVGSLLFALPEDFAVSEDVAIPGSTVTFTPPQSAEGDTLGAVAVFVEDLDLGPLEIRTDLTRQVRTDQLGVEPVGSAERVEVPGSLGATLLVWEYEQQVQPSGRTLPSVIGEVSVQTEENPQYSVSASGAEEVWSREDVDAFVRTLTLAGADAGA